MSDDTVFGFKKKKVYHLPSADFEVFLLGSVSDGNSENDRYLNVPRGNM